MTQTPLQEAINEAEVRLRVMEQQKASELELLRQQDQILYLESLLPKEKEFAEKCFDAGSARMKIETDKYQDGFNRALADKTTHTKQQFLNQLYPEK